MDIDNIKDDWMGLKISLIGVIAFFATFYGSYYGLLKLPYTGIIFFASFIVALIGAFMHLITFLKRFNQKESKAKQPWE